MNQKSRIGHGITLTQEELDWLKPKTDGLAGIMLLRKNELQYVLKVMIL